MSKYCGAQRGGCGAQRGGCGQQRGFGGAQGSGQQESVSQLLQQLVNDRAKAPKNAKLNSFVFITTLLLLSCFRNQN